MKKAARESSRSKSADEAANPRAGRACSETCDFRALVDDFAETLGEDPAPELPWRADLALYLERLVFYGRAFNLVGKKSPKDILDDLVRDSFELARLLGRAPLGDAPLALDCGAGAGLPGLPLRMIWREGEYVLAEIRARRALFLENMLAEIRLPQTRVFAQDAAKFPARPDLLLSRAWRAPREALDFAARMLAPGGCAVIFAGEGSAPRHENFEAAASRRYASPGGARTLWLMRHVGGV